MILFSNGILLPVLTASPFDFIEFGFDFFKVFQNTFNRLFLHLITLIFFLLQESPKVISRRKLFLFLRQCLNTSNCASI